MLLVYFVPLSLLVGWLSGGRLTNIPLHRLRGLWLPVAAFLLESLIGPLASRTSSDTALWLIVPAEYILLGVFLWCNRRFRLPAALLSAGTALNCLVIGLNNWRMPVSSRIYDMPQLAELLEKIESGKLPEYVVIDSSTRLPWLGDVLHFDCFPGMSFASGGDFFLGVGVFFLLLALMRPAAGDSSSTCRPADGPDRNPASRE